MFKQAKDLKEGDVVIDRGRRFTVKRIIVNPDSGMISIVNKDDSWHGEYHPEEYLGVVADDDRKLHEDGYCAGTPDCWLCQDEKERLQELEAKACACGHQKERHYWTRRGRETLPLCRDCRECLEFERPDPENGFTVEEINKRWEYERQTEINRRAALVLFGRSTARLYCALAQRRHRT